MLYSHTIFIVHILTVVLLMLIFIIMLIKNANVDVAVAVDVIDFHKYNIIFISLLYLMFLML